MLVQADWYTQYLDIRREYPNPINFTQDLGDFDDPYCVLIGAARYSYIKNGPIKDEKVLHVLNPNLTDEQTSAFGNKIIDANDAEDFELAWSLLAEAMSYR